jgi:hypothetical protein
MIQLLSVCHREKYTENLLDGQKVYIIVKFKVGTFPRKKLRDEAMG